MKRIITSFLLLLMASLGMKASIVATFEYQPGYFYLTVIPQPHYSSGVQFLVYGSLGAEGFKVYGGGTSSLTSEVGPMTKIVFEYCSSSSLTFSSGNGMKVGSNIVWTGNTEQLSFTTQNTCLIKRIIVTIDDSNNPPPTSLDMLGDMEDGTIFTSAYPATVLWHGSNRLYLKDEKKGYGLIYGDVGRIYEQGDVIPAGWGGSVKHYGGEPELAQPLFGFEAPIQRVTVEPDTINFGQLDHTFFGHYVTVQHVRINLVKKVLIDRDGNEIPYYNQFNTPLPNDEFSEYNFFGIVGSYMQSNGEVIYQFLITDYEPKPGMQEIDYLDELFQLPQGTVLYFRTPLVVLYQNGSYLYVKDKYNDYGLMYGNAGGPFENGDSIVGCATWTTYQNNPQLTPKGEWTVVDHGPTQRPVNVYAVEDPAMDWVHMYVTFSKVTVTKNDNNNYTMSDNTDDMPLYNRFHITIPTYGTDPNELIKPTGDINMDYELNIGDVMELIDYILRGGGAQVTPPEQQDSWENCTVTGFLTVYQNEMELYPTVVSIKRTPSYDLNEDGEVNISDVNYLIDCILQ